MHIITKFTVATEAGIDTLLMLTKELAIQKFASLLNADTLDQYIADHFNERSLVAEINSMSNQWLVVYVDNIPAGYTRITSNGRKPQALEGKRVMRIADFGILKEYTDPAISNSLFEKCLTVCRSSEGVWINEYTGHPQIEFFEQKGFVRQKEAGELDELPLVSVCLIRKNN